MAHSNNSIIVGKLQGSLGKELVFREWEGKTVVAKAPKKRKGGPTEKQQETLDKFEFASLYAKGVMNGPDEDLRQAYIDAQKSRQNLYSRIMEDFLTAPEVKSINTRNYNGAIGEKITIRAKDDFRVTRVIVEIYSSNGTLLEKGNAAPGENHVSWVYTATQANNALAGSKIKAIAIDIPENEGILEVTL